MAGKSSMSTLRLLLSRCALQQSQQGSALLLLPAPLRQLSSAAAAAAAPAAGAQPGEVGGVSGIPEEHLNRRVLVYSPARVASQQGEGKTGAWKLRFPSTHKWENPLMGWTSTSDPLSYIGDHALTFDSKEAAIDFAKRHGWEPMAYEPQKPVKKPKSYADNFRWKGPPVQPE